VVVSDEGRGFEWQMEMFGERSGRFGLWSVADRVRDVGGTFDVQTAVGSGARFVMKLPLVLPQVNAAATPRRMQR
jgi:signal transduction histidine kinase